MRTGKKGWRKRIGQTFRDVNKRSELNDADLELDDAMTDKMFQSAQKRALEDVSKRKTVHKASYLAFQASKSVYGGSSSSDAIHPCHDSPMRASPGPSHAHQSPDAAPRPAAAGDSSDSDEAPPSNRFMAVMSKCHQGKDSAKPRPTPAAKGAATPKPGRASTTPTKPAAPTGTDKKPTKRKAVPDVDTEAAAKIQATMDDSDTFFLVDTRIVIANLKSTILKDVPVDDNCFNQKVRASSQDIIILQKSLREKIKSVNRRKTATNLKSDLEVMLSELDDTSALLKSLVTGDAVDDTDLVNKLNNMADTWTISASLYRRALKCLCTRDLKYANWTDFTGSTYTRMVDTLGSDEGKNLFFLQVNEVLQKLLRSVPLPKATWYNGWCCCCCCCCCCWWWWWWC